MISIGPIEPDSRSVMSTIEVVATNSSPASTADAELELGPSVQAPREIRMQPADRRARLGVTREQPRDAQEPGRRREPLDPRSRATASSW